MKDKKGKRELPERFTISTELLNHALGFLSTMPVYQVMELITKINMDITPVPEDITRTKDDVGPMSKPEPKTVKLNPNKDATI